jgi:hypothetical protein
VAITREKITIKIGKEKGDSGKIHGKCKTSEGLYD